MTVVLDTGPLIAMLNRDDPLHPKADALFDRVWAGEFGTPITSDYVLDEGLTHLRRRPARRELSMAFAELLGFGESRAHPPIRLVTTSMEFCREAAKTHFANYGRGLSFTDCTLLAHVSRHDATLLTFDSGFEGLAPLAK